MSQINETFFYLKVKHGKNSEHIWKYLVLMQDDIRDFKLSFLILSKLLQ